MVLNPHLYVAAVEESLGGSQPLVTARCVGGWPAFPFQSEKFREGC